MLLHPTTELACRSFADKVKGDLDNYALLAAIAIVESNGGKNNYPNFEPYWIPEGNSPLIEQHVQHGKHPKSNKIVNQRYAKYGPGSGCSFSSWQILYHTAADIGFSGAPWELWNDIYAIEWVVKLLNRNYDRGARTLEEHADSWNSGTYKDSIVPKRYIQKILTAYKQVLESK